MVQGSLETTNLLLGIMAVVSVLEALAIIGLGVMGYTLYRRAMQAISELDERHLAPLVARTAAILDDIKRVTGKVQEETERVDQAVRLTLDRVDETAGRVRANVRVHASRVVGVIRGIRTAIAAFLSGDVGQRRLHPEQEVP